jgi:hypothetical protein
MSTGALEYGRTGSWAWFYVLHVMPRGPRDAVQRFFFCRVAFGEMVPMASSGGVVFGRLYVS